MTRRENNIHRCEGVKITCNKNKVVQRIDATTNEILDKYNSIELAGAWAYNNGYTKTIHNGRNSIGNCLSGLSKLAYKFKWEYENKNNDLDNDYFLPIVDGVQEYELSIYDRLGKRVFRTDKYTNEYCTSGCNEAWDGKINGSGDFCTIGVYVYHIIVTDVNGKLRNYEGTVTLVR